MPLGLSDNLFKRIVSALLLLPFVLWPIYAGGWSFAFLLMIGGVLMVLEWCSLTGTSQVWKKMLAGLFVVAVVLVVQLTDRNDGHLFIAMLAALAIGGALVAKKVSEDGWWFSGIGYVGLPLVSLLLIRNESAVVVLWVFLVVWATDVGGYFAGKGIGGPKLAPRVSPKKTWAGLAGGVALSSAVSFGLAWGFQFEQSHWVLAGLLAIVAQMGDLAESALKRGFGVKDSGGLIPGHGGLLDRVDGLVFVAPVVALVMYVTPLFGFEL